MKREAKAKGNKDSDWLVNQSDIPILLTAFDFEVSQALKSYYTDEYYQRKRFYTFARDYTKYFPIDQLTKRSV